MKSNRCLLGSLRPRSPDRVIPAGSHSEGCPVPHARSFDAGRSPPHLGVVLESLGGREKLSDRRALVPGSGRGYDVETLAKYVASATGLELAPTAVASAREYLGSKAVTNAEVIQDDFLSPKTDATYDLGYGTCPLTTHRSPTHGSGLRATHCLLLTACYSPLLDAP
ncbi:MAG: class I SAM-dependent methyltransferase [bacterium]